MNDSSVASVTFVNPQFFASGRVHSNCRRFKAERCINLVSGRNKSSRQLGWSTLEWPQMALPFRYVSLPENGSVEGISCNQLPLRGQLNRDSTSFLHDLEHATVCANKGTPQKQWGSVKCITPHQSAGENDSRGAEQKLERSGLFDHREEGDWQWISNITGTGTWFACWCLSGNENHFRSVKDRCRQEQIHGNPIKSVSCWVRCYCHMCCQL